MTLFGCSHERYTFPLTPRKLPRIRAARLTGTYVACLDCGKELPYDWDEMRIVNAKKIANQARKRKAAEEAGSQASY